MDGNHRQVEEGANFSNLPKLIPLSSKESRVNFDYIFVITYGRSGSTLLQGLLNAIPGVLIRGENNGTLRSLIRAWSSLSLGDKDFLRDTSSPKHAWYGSNEWNTEQYGKDLASAFIKNVLRPSQDTKVIGFKEIRYFPPHFDPNVEINFMRKFFPRCAFLVNTRNLDDVYESMQKANHSVTRNQLERADAMLKALVGAPDVFHIHYNDYVSSPNSLMPLFDFLGADMEMEKALAVMAEKHSVQHPQHSQGRSENKAE